MGVIFGRQRNIIFINLLPMNVAIKMFVVVMYIIKIVVFDLKKCRHNFDVIFVDNF